MDTPNEFWVGHASNPCLWVVDPDGDVSETDNAVVGVRYDLGVDADCGAMTRDQADAVRDLLVELVEHGALSTRPSKGVQYPTGATCDCFNQFLNYLRCFTDQCGVPLVSAHMGVCTGISWIDGSPPQAPPEPLPLVEGDGEWFEEDEVNGSSVWVVDDDEEGVGVVDGSDGEDG